MALSTNFGFKLASVGIPAAFLQSKVLDREVFLEPPADVKRQGIIWQLKKPLYGLDDASQKFWLRVKDVFLNKLHLRTVEGDKAFYFQNLDREYRGAVLTHVDNFELVGTAGFVEEVLSVVEKELTVSKIEEDVFRYTGLDVKMVSDRIEIWMENHSKSLKEMMDIRKTDDRIKSLTKLEMKLHDWKDSLAG